MLLYSVNAITRAAPRSQGEVTVRLQNGGRVVNGVGADPDIVVASAKAYLSGAEQAAKQGRARRGPGLIPIRSCTIWRSDLRKSHISH